MFKDITLRSRCAYFWCTNKILYYSWFSERIYSLCYIYFVQQSSSVKLKNLIVFEESLAHQMTEVFIWGGDEDALFTNKKKDNNKDKDKKDDANNKPQPSSNNGTNWKKIKYYKCGKLSHIKKKYHVMIKGENIASNEDYCNVINKD